jgi:hypothetical protein
MLCELFYKLKNHPSAVASWLTSFVNEYSDCSANLAIASTAAATEVIKHPSGLEDDTSDKRATLEEPDDTSGLL